MSLPKSVQDSISRAEAAQQALSGTTPETEAPTETTQETPEVAETPPEPVLRAQPDDAALWEQRYKSFKGHADAELAKMREAMQQMQAELEALKSKPAPEPTPEISSADVETFGKDLIDLQERVARKVMADSRKLWEAERQALLNRIGELEGGLTNVGQQVHQTTEERFWGKFERLVPDWETVNANQAFLTWLSGHDPLSGFVRQDILAHAQKQMNAERLAAVFNAWKQEVGATAPSPKRGAQQELERQVSPKKGGNQAAPVNDRKVWSQADIQTFYTDMVRGKYTQEAAARIEADIQQAVTEGRVR